MDLTVLSSFPVDTAARYTGGQAQIPEGAAIVTHDNLDIVLLDMK